MSRRQSSKAITVMSHGAAFQECGGPVSMRERAGIVAGGGVLVHVTVPASKEEAHVTAGPVSMRDRAEIATGGGVLVRMSVPASKEEAHVTAAVQ